MSPNISRSNPIANDVKLQASRFAFTDLPRYSNRMEQPVVGNPAILEELRALLKQHGDSPEPIRTITPWDGVRLPINTHLFSGLNIDGDDHPDFLLVRSFALFVAPSEAANRKTVGFAALINGTEASDATGEPSADMIKGAKLLWQGRYPGEGHPVTNLKAADSNRDGLHEIEFDAFDASRMTFGKVRFDPASRDRMRLVKSIPEQYRADRALFDQIAAVQGYALNSIGYFEILQGAEFDKGIAGSEAASKLVTTIYNRLSFAFAELGRRYQAATGNREAVVYYNEQDPDFLPFVKAAMASAEEVLTLTEGENKRIAEITTRAEKALKEATEAFSWKGKTMTRAEFYSTLAETKDPAERKKLLVAYTGNNLKALMGKGGLFGIIDELNSIARAHGFETYADYMMRVAHRSSVKAFVELSEDYHRRHGKEIAAFIADLRRVGGGRPVHEWDVHYLTSRLISEKLGGKAVPKLTFGDALRITKRYFKDLGLDLDEPPFAGNILYDTKKRENKYGNAFATTLGDGKRVWFNTNFDPKEMITLEDLETVVHEMTHDIHMIVAAQRARGNVMNGIGGQPGMWAEGIAIAMQEAVQSREWMDRYLSELPQFADPGLRAAISEVRRRANAYEHMVILNRARWELNLYRTVDDEGKPRSIEERLQFWPELTRNYLHVEAMDATAGARVYATPHFSGTPIYYVSYEGGYPLGSRATATLHAGLEGGDDAMMRRGARIVLNLFGEGARLSTMDDMAAALEELKADSR